MHRIPTNGGPTTKGVTEIEKWLGKRKWDLIHFNWGLHDLKYMGKDGTNLVPKEKGGIVQVPLSEYEKNLGKTGYPDEKIDQAIGLAKHHAHSARFQGRYVGDSVKYNQAAARVMKKHGVPTLDLLHSE